MKKVLLSKAIHDDGMAVLAGQADVVVATDNDLDKFKALAADVDGIILRTNLRVDADIMDAAPKLKIISRTGVGVDNVDVEAATERNIKVCNTVGANVVSVAEHALALIVALAKQLKMMDRALSVGEWKARNTYKAIDLEGKTLGLAGLGRIGKCVARKCSAAFNMQVIGFDPYVAKADGITAVSELDDMLRQADVVSIHVPYMQETHHMVDARRLGLMKKSAFLINTARGPVVDRAALLEALRTESIAGAGLDVFENEPPASDDPLLALDNVIATPHSAALTAECVARVAARAAQAIIDEFSGRTPKHIFNRKGLRL